MIHIPIWAFGAICTGLLVIGTFVGVFIMCLCNCTRMVEDEERRAREQDSVSWTAPQVTVGQWYDHELTDEEIAEVAKEMMREGQAT